jgi:hypothetical protein
MHLGDCSTWNREECNCIDAAGFYREAAKSCPHCGMGANSHVLIAGVRVCFARKDEQ